MNNRIPKYVLKNAGCKTTREFKQLKRRQVRIAEKAVLQLMRGSAYVPSGFYTAHLRRELADIKRDLSIKEWGR